MYKVRFPKGPKALVVVVLLKHHFYVDMHYFNHLAYLWLVIAPSINDK